VCLEEVGGFDSHPSLQYFPPGLSEPSETHLPDVHSCSAPISKHFSAESTARSLVKAARHLGEFIASLILFLVFFSPTVRAQGGPPYYTNDPGTPGNLQWEINLGYMPFLYPDSSITHTPDVDINFGLGDRIQLTFENAWLRVDNPSPAKYGLGQDQLGLKWRFYDNKDSGFAMSIFPQLSINNPNHSVERGITPRGASLILPIEFTKKLGPVDINWEGGYNLVHKGPDGWLAGLVVGHEFTDRLELDAEFYSTGTFHPATNQETLEGGLRYKIHPPFILLIMAGRSLQPAGPTQPYFVGYFGMQFLLPPHPFEKE
jgi:hypothetical protein